ncbi:MAG: hypothetical protein RML32_10685, partial [Gammaproteobacteria bacterium]|nr:hypothetical protein [Gammaproteobacteria bacterium]
MRTLGIFIWRTLLLLLALVVLTVATVAAIDFAVLRNLVLGPEMGRVDQTDRNVPQEAVAGREAYWPPELPPDTIDPGALQRAEAYAAQTDSVALLVYHRGALRYEKYFPGYDQDFRTDSFSGHKSVLALLVGAAIADGLIDLVE